jgi:hypothetical protein
MVILKQSYDLQKSTIFLNSKIDRKGDSREQIAIEWSESLSGSRRQ